MNYGNIKNFNFDFVLHFGRDYERAAFGARISRSAAVIKLTGAGHKIDGNQASRVITVSANGTLYLQNITITGGNDPSTTGGGGGVYSDGALFLQSGGVISGNTATNSGGGIYISEKGVFDMSGGEISGNMSNYSDYGNGGGGGAYIGSPAENNITGGKISGNNAFSGGGIYIASSYAYVNNKLVNYNGNLNLSNCEISGNTAGYGGAGIYVKSDATCSITSCKISENSAYSSGGGIYTVGDLTVTDCEFSMDSAYYGGAIEYGAYADALLSIGGNTVFSNNTAERDGGAIEVPGFNRGANYTIGADVVFSGNKAEQAYIFLPADSAKYNQHVFAKSFTWPFANGCNNFDISCLSSNGYLGTPYYGITEIFSNLPASASTGAAIQISGTVAPDFLQPQTIVWSVKKQGTTGAAVSGNLLTTPAFGIVTVTATIKGGMMDGSDYAQDFYITVNPGAPGQSIQYGGKVNPAPAEIYAKVFRNNSQYLGVSAFDEDGNLYTSHEGPGIEKTAAGSSIAKLWNSSIKDHYALVYNNGYLYTTDRDKLYKINISTQDTTLLYTFTPTRIPYDDFSWLYLSMTFDAGGHLWIAYDRQPFLGITCKPDSTAKLYKMTPDCSVIEKTFTLPGAAGLAFDSDGSLLVGGNFAGDIFRLNPVDGTYTNLGFSKLNRPMQFKFDVYGNLFIAAFYDRAIYKLAPGSQTLETIVSNLTVSSSTLAFDPAGNLYIDDRNGNDDASPTWQYIRIIPAVDVKLLYINDASTAVNQVGGTAGANDYVKVTVGNKTAIVQADATGKWNATSALGAFPAETVYAQAMRDAEGKSALSGKVHTVLEISTGIPAVETGCALSLHAWVENGMLHVSGLAAGETWRVYNVAGGLIYQNVAIDTQNIVLLQNRGIYIVKQGNYAVKAVW